VPLTGLLRLGKQAPILGPSVNKDDPQPPKRRLALKPREVEPVDKVARPGDGTAISVKLIHRENQLAEGRQPGSWSGDLMTPPEAAGEPEGDPSIFKPKEITPIDAPSKPGDEGAISVQGMLHRNLAAAADTAPELIAMPVRRRSRRNRDFLLLLGCAALSVGVLAVVFREDRQMVALALFGIVFTTVILAWVMYGIMDRY
jgi:hypothetical protein